MLGTFLGSEDPVESLIEQTNTATKRLLSSGTLVIRGKENPHGMRRGNKILVERRPLLSYIFLILLDWSHCLYLFICLSKLYFGIILDWTKLQQLYRISVYILPCSLTLTSFITTVHLAKPRHQHWYILLTNSTFYLGVTDFSTDVIFLSQDPIQGSTFLSDIIFP